jgi:hypothetical protein
MGLAYNGGRLDASGFRRSPHHQHRRKESNHGRRQSRGETAGIGSGPFLAEIIGDTSSRGFLMGLAYNGGRLGGFIEIPLTPKPAMKIATIRMMG